MQSKADLIIENRKLINQKKRLMEALKYFLKRVEEGSIRSKVTYKKYLDLVQEINQEDK